MAEYRRCPSKSPSRVRRRSGRALGASRMQNRAALFLLLVLSGSAFADGANAHDVSSGSPCQPADLRNFRSAVFAKAAEPAGLWRFVGKALCGFDEPEGSIAVVRPYLAPSIRYVEETFTSEGDIETDVRTAGPGEIAGILV